MKTITDEQLIELKLTWGMSREQAEFERDENAAMKSGNALKLTQLRTDHPEWCALTYNED